MMASVLRGRAVVSYFADLFRVENGGEAFAFLPYLITAGIALCFAIAGMYGLAYNGAVRRLPLQTWVVWFTCIVFLLRAVVWLVVLLSNFTRHGENAVGTRLYTGYLPLSASSSPPFRPDGHLLP